MKHRMSNKMLAHWCATGKGQVCIKDVLRTTYEYPAGESDINVPPGIKIRPWNTFFFDEPEYEDEVHFEVDD